MTEDRSPAELPPTTRPMFPEPQAVQTALLDYHRRADRMVWSPYDLAERGPLGEVAKPQCLSEVQIAAVKTVLFVEDHLPGYLSEYLRIMTDPALPDDQLIVQRQVLHFTFRWVAEEDRHAHVLERYLTRTGLAQPGALDAEMLRERKTAYVFPYDHNHQLTEGFIYLALQEKATHLYYRALARDVDEPVLKSILTRMGADEASHGAFFYDMLCDSFRGDLDALSRKISAVANDFKMPVQNNLQNYRRQLLGMMRAAPSYRHPDVFADMMRAVERAAQRHERDALQLITPQLGAFEDQRA